MAEIIFSLEFCVGNINGLWFYMGRIYSFGYFHVLLISMNSTKLQVVDLFFLYSAPNVF